MPAISLRIDPASLEFKFTVPAVQNLATKAVTALQVGPGLGPKPGPT